MKCPHCGVTVHLDSEIQPFVAKDEEFGNPAVNIEVAFCPECQKPIIYMEYGRFDGYDSENNACLDEEIQKRIFPIWGKNTILPDEIPEKYRNLYTESEQVNNISPRASATLSRYLLQMLLHEELHIIKRNLEEEIKELETKSNVPSELITMLQVMRRVANFGAHPKKSTNSGEIIEVEKGESDVMLELLQQLFDYLFIKPKRQEEFLKSIEEKYGIKA